MWECEVLAKFLHEWSFQLRMDSYIYYDKIRSMGPNKILKPTEGELEILQVLWEKGEATVRDVHEELSRSKDIGYTTALKLLQIMFEKGLVSRDESAKSHIYKAAVSREKTQKQLVGKMISTLFAGSPGQLVMQALGNHQASADELDQIQKLLDNLKKK
jgi:BlaI family transcriptional regulator, penicillinase repressor